MKPKNKNHKPEDKVQSKKSVKFHSSGSPSGENKTLSDEERKALFGENADYLIKNKTLSEKIKKLIEKDYGIYYFEKNLEKIHKECFDRIKKRLFEENDESQNLNYNKTIFIINEEIGDFE